MNIPFPAIHSPITMNQLEPGEWATIVTVETDATDLLRLMGLGICEGRRLLVLKNGDPMILQVYGSRIGLSARLARRITVTPMESPAPAGRHGHGHHGHRHAHGAHGHAKHHHG